MVRASKTKETAPATPAKKTATKKKVAVSA